MVWKSKSWVMVINGEHFTWIINWLNFLCFLLNLKSLFSSLNHKMIEFQEKPLKKGLIREKENSLSHKAFGCWVKGRQLHRVGQRRPHFRQNSFVRDKLLFPVNAALINLRRRKLFWFGVYCMMGWILNHPPHQPEGRVFSPKQTGSPLALTFCSELDLRDIKTGPVNHPDPPPQKTLPDALGGF